MKRRRRRGRVRNHRLHRTPPLSGITDTRSTAYPLSSYSYLVTACTPQLASTQGTSCDGPGETSPLPDAKGQELGQYIDYFACAGQQEMSELGYAPLPPNLVQEDFNAIGRLNGGVQPPPPTAANCPNPTLDG